MIDSSFLVPYIFDTFDTLVTNGTGWTEELPPAYPDLKKAGDSAAKALKSLYGTEYTVGSSTQVLCTFRHHSLILLILCQRIRTQ